MQGKWLGGWPGEWFGDAGEPDPNAISGTAAVSVTATGTLEAASGAMSGAASLSITATASAVQPDASGGALAGLREAIRRDAEARKRARALADAVAEVVEVVAYDDIAIAARTEADALQAALSQQIAIDAISTAQETSAEAERLRKNRNRAAMLAALLLMQ
jgi:hypothetical protein